MLLDSGQQIANLTFQNILEIMADNVKVKVTGLDAKTEGKLYNKTRVSLGGQFKLEDVYTIYI